MKFGSDLKFALLLATRDRQVHACVGRTLAAPGWVVFHALNAAEAFARFQAVALDAMLVDLDASDLEGWDIAEDALCGCPALPLVLRPGRPNDFGQAANIASAPALAKLFGADQLQRMLRALRTRSASSWIALRTPQHVFVRHSRPFWWTVPIRAYRHCAGKATQALRNSARHHHA